MPTYVYACQKCGEVFEVQASFKQKEQGLKPACPACHGKRSRPVLTTAGLVVRGSDGASAPHSSCSPGCSGNCGNCNK
jgi:putative FmdB family regulatory protein